MCLIVVAWRVHPDYPLVVAANRDEFYARPTAPAAFWETAPAVLAGRDLEGGGTWLGISRDGRFAALTNYREGGKQRAGAPSRGALVADFLAADRAADVYLDDLAARGGQFNGFNLLVGDRERLGYYANRGRPGTGERPAAPRWLPPGIYGLSNHLLDTPWPKLAAAKAAFTEALRGLPATQAFFDLLADREIVADHHLPETGVPLAWERILSAVFVAAPDYGTRASTLLTLAGDGRAVFVERAFGAAGTPLGEVRQAFTLR